MFEIVRDKAPLGLLAVLGFILLISGVTGSAGVVAATVFCPAQVLLVGKE